MCDLCKTKGTAQEFLTEIGRMGGYAMAFDDEMLRIDPANFDLPAELLDAAHHLSRAYADVAQCMDEFEQAAEGLGFDLDVIDPPE